MARRGLEPKPGCRLWTSRLQRQSIKSLKSRECKLGAGRALGPPPRSSQCRPCIWQDLLEPFCLVQADQSRPFGSGLWTILSVAPNQRATGDRKCDMCATEEGELVPTSAEWQNALWIAEKHIVTWVQPMVQSPILGTRRQHIASGRNRWGCAANRASNGFGDTTKILPERVQFWSQLATYQS